MLNMSSSPTQTVLAITTLSGMAMFDYATGAQIAKINTPVFSISAWAPTWSHDGKRLAFPSTKTAKDTFSRLIHTLMVVNHDGSGIISVGDTRSILGVSWESNDLRLSVEFPHNEVIVVSSHDLRLAEPMNGRYQLTFGPQSHQCFYWKQTPQGWDLQVSQKGDLYNTDNIMTITPSQSAPPQVLWSPKGDRLLIVVGRDHARQVVLYDLTTMSGISLEHELLQGAKGFAWAPDNEAFAFITLDNTNAGVCELQ
jgi:hypothetical protein